MFDTNPRFLLSQGDYDMLRLWRLFAPGMGAGYLPDYGGVLDQSSVMMDAYAFMSSTEKELEKLYGKSD